MPTPTSGPSTLSLESRLLTPQLTNPPAPTTLPSTAIQPSTWTGLSTYSADWARTIPKNQKFLAGALGLLTTAELWDLIHTDTELALVLRDFISARGTWFGADGFLRTSQKQTCFHTVIRSWAIRQSTRTFSVPTTPPLWASCTARKKFTAYALLRWAMALLRAKPRLFPRTDLTPGAERVDAFEVFVAARLLNYVYHPQAHCGGLAKQVRPKKVVPAVAPVRVGGV
ncbi:hypothetical protein BO99DRAFT_401992 [Aspergillus violaceofuscus CBS 115571]|uniref:Uncharacterized protein n=1 Tax=Aspergillus violaceofuscus (strain CBS 115571) TaxID=1450538 RepID=A0A2V5H7A4_ASPV1|nr:hypothetical protein BO99DRAFT_401992 [Aspergillus violaceofuscus CBS 115571]